MSSDAPQRPSATRLSRLAEGLIRHYRGLFLLALLLTAVALWPASKLRLEESIESFYAPDNPHLQAYVQSKRWFGGDEFVLAAYRDPDLLHPEHLSRLREFSAELSSVPGVQTGSTQDIALMISGVNEAAEEMLGSGLLARLAVRLFRESILEFSERILIGEDHETAAIVLRLEPEQQTRVSRTRTFARIRELAAAFDPAADADADDEDFPDESPETGAEPDEPRAEGSEVRRQRSANPDGPAPDVRRPTSDEHTRPSPVATDDGQRTTDAHPPVAVAVAGEQVQIHDMFRYVEQDGTVLGLASSGLLILVILVLFRSLRWTLLPLLVVHAALVWTRALLVISGIKLSMVSSILTSLVTIIGIATVTHVTVRFRELRRDHDRPDAFRRTFVDLGPAIGWTCGTTAVGFAALLSSGITPVRSFGLMMASGTMFVLLAAILLLPGGILIGRFDADPRRTLAEGRLLALLSQVTHWVEHRGVLLLSLMVVLALAAGAGFARLQVQTDFTKNFRADSPIIQSIDFFEEHLGGVGNWEVNFAAPAELDEAFLDRVSRAADDVRGIDLPGGLSVTKTVALTDGLDMIPGAVGRTLDRRREALKLVAPEFEESLYNPAAGRMRIVLRALERQPAETKLQLIHRVEEVVRRTFPDAQATGLYVLLAHLIQSLLADQLVSFCIAAAGIFVMMAFAFRSLAIGLISLIPNMFPILLVIGGMGWAGVPINIGTAMIASVSMGLTVDSSIHYLSGYRRAREGGAQHFEALRQTHAGVGRALIFANVALVLGFTVLALSNFIPLIYFGVLVSLAMLGGLLGNLVLLPLLLGWVRMPVGDPPRSGA